MALASVIKNLSSIVFLQSPTALIRLTFVIKRTKYRHAFFIVALLNYTIQKL